MNTFLLLQGGYITIEKSEDSSSFTFFAPEGTIFTGDMLDHDSGLWCDLALTNGFCIPLISKSLFRKLS